MEFTEEEKLALKKLKSERLKAIYLYLVYHSQTLEFFDAKQKDLKTKLSFRYYIEGTTRKHPFAFIVNRKSLLFHFTKYYQDLETVERELKQNRIRIEDKSDMRITVKIVDDEYIAFIKQYLTEFNPL